MATEIIADTPEYTVTRTTSAAGFADAWVPKPGTTWANADTISARAQAALTANSNLQAATAPTVGSLAQAQTAVNTIWAAMQTQSKELTALIRLALNLLDSTSGT